MKRSPSPLVLAGLIVHYDRDAPERYEARIQRGIDGHTRVELQRPFVEPLVVEVPACEALDDASIARHAVEGLVRGFFGDQRAAPRIVGAPDWNKVSLEVTLLREQSAKRLLFVEVAIEAPGQATCLRASTERGLGGEPVTLCPEDADPIYAVTRLAASQPREMAAPRRSATAPLALPVDALRPARHRAAPLPA